MTFGQTVPKLNSRPIYCSGLYNDLNSPLMTISKPFIEPLELRFAVKKKVTYFSMAYTVTAFQSRPSGTLIVVTVGVLAPGAAMKHSSPISFRPKINKSVM